jgi:hypothetical protein
MMRVVIKRPPIYDACVARFGPLPPGVMFCWGDTIYNPGSSIISRELFAHERVHSIQQAGDPETWWHRYLADDRFRLDQELPAHVTELFTFHCNHPGGAASGKRRLYLHAVASRIASPMYGRLIGYEEARRVIKIGLDHLIEAAGRIPGGATPADAGASADALASRRH